MEYYNQSTEIICSKLVCAREILKEIWPLIVEIKKLQAEAKKEREEAKKLGKNRWIIPLVSLGTVFTFQNFGVIIAAVLAVILWLPRNSPKLHIEKAKECEKKIQEKKERIGILARKYGDVLNLIPLKYWHPSAAAFLFEALQSRRAATLSAAHNLLEAWVCNRELQLKEQSEQKNLQKARESAEKANRIREGINIGIDIAMLLDDIIRPNKDDCDDYWDDDFD